MAAHLDQFQLRRHALPVFNAAELDRDIDRGGGPGPRAARRLAASWHIGESGRPVCIWSFCAEGDSPPPD